MPTSYLFAACLAGVGVLAYQLFVTSRLVGFGGYSRNQKLAQALLIWVLPLIGACVVHYMIRSTERPFEPEDRNFVRSDHPDFD